MHSDASKLPNQSFLQAVVERIDKLSPDQQMHVMQACQFALAHVSSQAPPPATVVPPAPASPPATVPPPPPIQYQLPAPYQHHALYQFPAPYQHPAPYQFPTTSSVPPLPAQPQLPAHYHQSPYTPIMLQTQPSSPPTTSSASQSLYSIPQTIQIPIPTPGIMSTRSLSFSTPSPSVLPSDPSPPQSSLHTPTVEVVQYDSPSSIISTPHYLNL
ncbi:uncharacterized protein [Ranitomeya imitator]|uniref:uncharacterized protein n=1 Tax=Ranitomeya imitator TaxID=111125 RepID=UPI0037E7284C